MVDDDDVVPDDELPALDESVGLVRVVDEDEDGDDVEPEVLDPDVDPDDVDPDDVEGDVADPDEVEGDVAPEDELGEVCAIVAPPNATAPASTIAVNNGLRVNVVVFIRTLLIGYSE